MIMKLDVERELAEHQGRGAAYVVRRLGSKDSTRMLGLSISSLGTLELVKASQASILLSKDLNCLDLIQAN